MGTETPRIIFTPNNNGAFTCAVLFHAPFLCAAAYLFVNKIVPTLEYIPTYLATGEKMQSAPVDSLLVGLSLGIIPGTLFGIIILAQFFTGKSFRLK